MKKVLVASLSMFLAFPVIALAQDPAQQNSNNNSDPMKQGSPSTAAKTTSVKGTVSEDGKTFVSDADGKSWTIANPDAVKGHEGHHVQVTGTADSGTSQLQVTSVKMLKGDKSSMKKDSTPPQQ
jgi:hypothetical protein